MAGVVEVRRLVGLARYPAVACGSLLRIVLAISVCKEYTSNYKTTRHIPY